MEGFESDSTFFFVRLNKCNMTRLISQTWQCDPALSHIFAGAVRIAGFTWLVALQEEELARAFVGVALFGQRDRESGVEGKRGAGRGGCGGRRNTNKKKNE